MSGSDRATVPHRGWTLLPASLGVFMASLDTLVVATALPVLRTDLGASLADLEWTVNGYNLAFACLLLTGSALGDRFGRRRTYVVGVAVFTAASAGGALSPGVGVLLAARVLQGAGAAVLFPLTLTLISAAFPPERRSAAIGIWAGIAGSAVALGPLVGGAVIQGLAWQWIFWLNVPIGLVLMPLSAAKLTESFGQRPRLDIVGLCLVSAGMLSLTGGLIQAPSRGWGSAEVLAATALGALLVAGFVIWEQHAKHPMLPVALFARRGFSTGNAAVFFVFAALLGALFLMVQLLQTAFELSPVQAGLRLLPWTGVPAVVAPLVGRLSGRVGNRPFLVTGLALQALGLGWTAAIVEPGMPYGTLSVVFLTAGIGVALCLPTVASTVLSSVQPCDAGVAAGVNSAVRQLGGVFGVAVVAAVFARRGSYTSPQTFLDGFTPALWVAALLSAAGLPAALLSPARPSPITQAPLAAQHRPGGRPGGAGSTTEQDRPADAQGQ